MLEAILSSHFVFDQNNFRKRFFALENVYLESTYSFVSVPITRRDRTFITKLAAILDFDQPFCFFIQKIFKKIDSLPLKTYI